MKRTVVVVVAVLLGSGGVALARDHRELVCSAVVDNQDGGDRIPLFIHLFEHRSADGTSRDETLSTVYQGRLFQATRVNASGDLPKAAPIVLGAGKRIRFRGTYTLDDATGAFVLTLTGKVNDDPRARTATFRDVTAALPCVDLSF